MDWEKEAGEKGERVTSGRFARAWKLGSVGAKAGASMLASKAKSLLGGADDPELAYQKQAVRVAEALGQLKGASMKIGQMLSADPELTPPGFAEALSGLQRDAPPMTYVTVKRQIEEALDRPIDVVFREFDPEPVGAASIGQVHRGVLADTGQVVAIKVQYPGVADALESDLKTLGSMMTYARPMVDKKRLAAYLEQIKAVLMEEADYVLEGQNMARFGAILGAREGVRCPKPVMEWTRERVLVMEFVEGEKLDDALERMGPEERADLLHRWVALFSWQFHECHEMHGDPHPGNFLIDEDGDLVVLDFGCVKAFPPELTDGLLDILDTCWQLQPERAADLYIQLGFGEGLTRDDLDANLIEEFHTIMLEPFLADEPFTFQGWEPGMNSKRFMLSNPAFLKLVPPADLLPYFRALSGIKGLLARFDGRVNVCRMAIETAERRGRLTGEPLV
jgi:predicted unusual protein kinase regulating ubiquinone biosynthesis (AarF/ABC1/UbiB family)